LKAKLDFNPNVAKVAIFIAAKPPVRGWKAAPSSQKSRAALRDHLAIDTMLFPLPRLEKVAPAG